MVAGIGIDLVENARIADARARFGDRFVDRILRPDEASYCMAQTDPTPSIAARFAAKEAVSKAFGVGIGASLGWHDLEVVRTASGKPEMRLHGGAAALAGKWGVSRVWVSITHTVAHAAAVAVLER
jgi:holo-[acyl-carrier protein] synthase